MLEGVSVNVWFAITSTVMGPIDIIREELGGRGRGAVNDGRIIAFRVLRRVIRKGITTWGWPFAFQLVFDFGFNNIESEVFPPVLGLTSSKCKPVLKKACYLMRSSQCMPDNVKRHSVKVPRLTLATSALLRTLSITSPGGPWCRTDDILTYSG